MQDMDIIAQKLEEGDQGTIVHLPSRAQLQVFLAGEVHIAQHQCQASRPGLQPIGLQKEGQLELLNDTNHDEAARKTISKNQRSKIVILTPPGKNRDMPTDVTISKDFLTIKVVKYTQTRLRCPTEVSIYPVLAI